MCTNAHPCTTTPQHTSVCRPCQDQVPEPPPDTKTHPQTPKHAPRAAGRTSTACSSRSHSRSCICTWPKLLAASTLPHQAPSEAAAGDLWITVQTHDGIIPRCDTWYKRALGNSSCCGTPGSMLQGFSIPGWNDTWKTTISINGTCARAQGLGEHASATRVCFSLQTNTASTYTCVSLCRNHTPQRHSGNTQGLGMNDTTPGLK